MPYFEWTLIGALRTLRSTHNNNDNQRSSMLRESEINQKGKARKLWDIEEGTGI